MSHARETASARASPQPQRNGSAVYSRHEPPRPQHEHELFTTALRRGLPRIGSVDAPEERAAGDLAERAVRGEAAALRRARSARDNAPGFRGGEQIDAYTRARFERLFGQDFSSVRIHTDGHAATFASSLGAAAFTVAEDIGFGPHRYRPDTAAGMHLLAHELTHVIQDRFATGPPVLRRAPATATPPAAAQEPWWVTAQRDLPQNELADLRAELDEFLLKGTPQEAPKPAAQDPAAKTPRPPYVPTPAETALVAKMAAQRRAQGVIALRRLNAPKDLRRLALSSDVPIGGRALLADLVSDAPDKMIELFNRWQEGWKKGEIKSDTFEEFLKVRMREFRGLYGEVTLALILGPKEMIVLAPEGVTEPGIDLITTKEGWIRLRDNKALRERARLEEVSALEWNLLDGLRDAIARIRKINPGPNVPPELHDDIAPRLERAASKIDAWMKKNPKADLESEATQKEFARLLAEEKIERLVDFAGSGAGAGPAKALLRRGFKEGERAPAREKQQTEPGLSPEDAKELRRANAEYEKELKREIRQFSNTGKLSPRLRELVERQAAPGFVERLKNAKSAAELAQAVEAVREAELRSAGYERGAARPYGGSVPLRTRGGAAALAIMEAIRIGAEVYEAQKQHDLAQRAQGWSDFRWYTEKLVTPPFEGVIHNWLSTDETITAVDKNGIPHPGGFTELDKRASELKAITLGKLPDEPGRWLGLAVWAEARVKNYDDYYAHFVEGNPPISARTVDGNRRWSYRISTWNWWGSGWEFVNDDELTPVMEQIVGRMVAGTEESIRRTWERPATEPPAPTPMTIRPTGPSPPPTRAVGESPLESLRPTRRARFKEDADKELKSFRPTRLMLEDLDWSAPPRFFVFDTLRAPKDCVVVGGADYSTYATMRDASILVYGPEPPTYIPRNKSTWTDEQKSLLWAAVGENTAFEYHIYEEDEPHDIIFVGEVRTLRRSTNREAIGLAKIKDLVFEQ